MEQIASLPITAKLSHIRAALTKHRMDGKRAMMADTSKALTYLNDIEKELRK